ncbi:MAG: hypothetical protein K2X82_05395 [Gemmataceae bacterium]|nr:hypothetical protein [Gemmataceae bacterium]
MVGAVLESPVQADDLTRLQVLEDVVEVGPAGEELASAEVVAAFFGGG